YYPADLYLEGSDQHRGWFQTSLIPSVALNGNPPYKTVLTHGFVLDENGKAMHKSLGNVVSPEEVIKKYGAEILRLWVALSNWSEDVRISDKLLSVPVDMYRKIRNTFRYLLGNLSGFKTERKLDYSEMLDIDKYMILRLEELTAKVYEDYKEFKYRDAIKRISDFCILDLSSFYLDVSKDRLYTMALNSKERLSAQSAMYEILKSLLVITSPILSFTCEEGWQVMKSEVDNTLSDSVFLNDIDLTEKHTDEEIKNKWDKIRTIRDMVLKEIEIKRKENLIGSSLEAKVKISSSDNFILENAEDIKNACIVSQLEALKQEGEIKIEVLKAEGLKCPRCWQWSKEIGKNRQYPELCPKCSDAMEKNFKDA
ncbi:MAG: class I tRNA ligase family protein, partial [Elusimicrobiales bacterium]|nr:class I tRNA ligase family protein [Elusimicrobiales bacterium]